MGKKVGRQIYMPSRLGLEKNGFSDPTQHWHFSPSDLDLPNICMPKKREAKGNIRAGEQRC